MSKMQELFEKVSNDDVLQEKFSAIMKNAEAEGKEETEARLTAFAKEAGYDVTVEEMQAFFQERAEKNKELSDEELDLVAGGKSSNSSIATFLTFGIGCGLVSASAVKNGMVFTMRQRGRSLFVTPYLSPQLSYRDEFIPIKH